LGDRKDLWPIRNPIPLILGVFLPEFIDEEDQGSPGKTDSNGSGSSSSIIFCNMYEHLAL